MKRTLLALSAVFAVFILTACGEDDLASSCGPANCMGCCTAEGRCLPSPDEQACGINGAICMSCSVGSQCLGGICKRPSSQCSPLNCSGCCDAAGNCITPISNEACGAIGASCQNCTLSGQICDSAQGTCSSSSCVPNCTNKCAGDSDGCGGICQVNDCKEGCCQQGQCVVGKSDSACGSGGAPCENCNAKGTTCVSETSTCAGCTPDCAGKCDGDGDGCGGKCEQNPCEYYETCLNGDCLTNMDTQVIVTVSSARILDIKDDWDSYYGSWALPDPGVCLWWDNFNCGSSTTPYISSDVCTPEKEDTYSPAWDYDLPPRSLTDLLAGYICIQLVDADIPPFYELIGTCLVNVTLSDVRNGYLTLWSCPHPTQGDYVDFIDFSFSPAP